MISTVRTLFFAAILAAGPCSAAAQTVLVRVVEGDVLRPMVGALAYLVDDSGETWRNALTDERGRALFVGVPTGSYRVRVEMIGMATAESDLFAAEPGITVTQEVRLASSAIVLEGIDVELESGRCSVRPGEEGLLVAQIWDEARKALSAAAFTDRKGTYRYETLQYERRIDRNSGTVLSEDRERREGYMTTPFESQPAEDLVENGFVQPDGNGFMYYAPDADVLLSDPFLDTHCFKIEEYDRGEERLVGLGFEPTGDDRRVANISGTLWLSPETAELRWLDYRYEYLAPDMMSDEVGGRVDFRRMPDGTWIVPEWWIRMPVMTSQTDFQGNRRPYIGAYLQAGGRVIEVREAGGRSLGQRAQDGGVEGVVVDSLGVPLRGVRVGVVGSNQEVFTNAEGAFSITGLTEGRYLVRFVDARLELMGYIPEPVERDVIRGELSYVQYHMPSVGDVLFEACRGVEREEGHVVLAGSVVDGGGRSVPEATVRVQWVSYEGPGGRMSAGDVNRLRERTSGFETTANANGFFHFCDVPPGTGLRVTAASGELESEEYEVMIPDYETGALRVLEIGGMR